MMLGVTRQHRLSYPTVDIPPWPLIEDPTDESGHVTSVGGYVLSPYSPQQSSGRDFLAAIHQYLPSNQPDPKPNPDAPDSIACDEFRMYEFKVRRCSRDRSHDWTDCPFAHPGEKARRRDPRKFHYSGTACPDIRKGACMKGDACEFAHGVFECWLHPARYRTQPCKDGVNCRRKVCFFAHSAEQLRVVSPTMSARVKFLLSPEPESPPLSPMSEAGALAAAMRVLQLGKAKSMPSSLGGLLGFGVSPGYSSLPATPTQMMASLGSGVWADGDDEEPVMGRALRAKMFERIRKDNMLDPAVGSDEPSAECPDVGWVSDLVR